MDTVMQFKGTIYEKGYGLIAQQVMRDPELHATSKLIYSYICSFAAGGQDGERTAFPSIELQCNELGINENTYYKYRKPLIDKGYLSIGKMPRKKGSQFNNNLYSIEAVPTPPNQDKTIKNKEKSQKNDPYPNKQGTEPYPISSGMVESCTKKSGTNSNILNSNILNNKKEEEEEIKPAAIQSIMNEFISKYEITNQKTIKAIEIAVTKCKATKLESVINFVTTVVEEKMSKFGQKQQSTKKTSRRVEIIPEFFDEKENSVDHSMSMENIESSETDEKGSQLQKLLKQKEFDKKQKGTEMLSY